MKGDDEKEIYVKCGIIHKASKEKELYLVKGIFFAECNYLEETSNIKDDIWQWGDGNIKKRVLLDFEKKLKHENKELKKHVEELEKREVGDIRQNTALGIQKLGNEHYGSDDESQIEAKEKKIYHQVKKKVLKKFDFLIDETNYEIKTKMKKFDFIGSNLGDDIKKRNKS